MQSQLYIHCGKPVGTYLVTYYDAKISSPLNAIDVRDPHTLEERNDQQREIPTVHIEKQEYIAPGSVSESHRQQAADEA